MSTAHRYSTVSLDDDMPTVLRKEQTEDKDRRKPRITGHGYFHNNRRIRYGHYVLKFLCNYDGQVKLLWLLFGYGMLVFNALMAFFAIRDAAFSASFNPNLYFYGLVAIGLSFGILAIINKHLIRDNGGDV